MRSCAAVRYYAPEIPYASKDCCTLYFRQVATGRIRDWGRGENCSSEKDQCRFSKGGYGGITPYARLA
jgi:hypothetical protein